MRDLTKYLENPFDDPDISVANLLNFTSDHLQRMIANNGNSELSARITATTSSLALVEDCVTEDQTKLAIRKSRKMVKDAFRKNLLKEIAKVHGLVVGRYGPDAPEVAECFPQGRSVFSDSPDDRVRQHIETVLNGVTAHQADLGAPLVATVQGLLDEWTAIYAASESSSGAVTTTQEGKRLARENLQLMLFITLLKLGEMFPRQPEKLELYMRQSLLEGATPPAEPPAPTPMP